MTSEKWLEIRLGCLAEANATAKLGLSHDVYATAERYFRWVTGEAALESAPALPFRQAVIDLMEAELRAETSDIEKMRHEMQEAFGEVEDRHWPSLNPLAMPRARPTPAAMSDLWNVDRKADGEKMWTEGRAHPPRTGDAA